MTNSIRLCTALPLRHYDHGLTLHEILMGFLSKETAWNLLQLCVATLISLYVWWVCFPPGSPCALPLPEDCDLNADLQPAHSHPEEPDVRRGDPGGSRGPPADLPEQGAALGLIQGNVAERFKMSEFRHL